MVIMLLLSTGACGMLSVTSSEEIVAYTEIPMGKALRTALRKVPGKATEAKLMERAGRIVYRIEIIDKENRKRTVYVDAEVGLLLNVGEETAGRQGT